MQNAMLLLMLVGCDVYPDEWPRRSDATDHTDVPEGPYGFIGSPCESDLDCDYDGGVCLTAEAGYPQGMCSAACDRFCDDADGHPTTFCVDAVQVPESPQSWDGGCFSRCDFGLFPQNGCREGYGCAVADRANDPARTYVCQPDVQTELSDCPSELAARGVPFELMVVDPSSPAEHPELTCSVADPVMILGEIHGVELRYANNTTPARTLAACEMALSLTDTVDDGRALGVTELYHLGTYNCRVISGTNTLSRHAFGDAIDISGFGFADGTQWTLIDDWEHDTTSPRTDAGKFLRSAAYRWYDNDYWNIILPPNYNAAHDDHFHIYLTPGSGFIQPTGPRIIGPAPYAD